MAAAEKQAGGGKAGPAFVAARTNPVRQNGEDTGKTAEAASAGNDEEIHISDDEEDL